MNLTNILEKALHINIIVVIVIVGGSLIKLAMMTRKELKENKHLQELKEKLDQEYGNKRLLKHLGRDDVKFPILVYSKPGSEVTFVETVDIYQEKYLWKGLGADYILDSLGKRYIGKKHTGKELDIQMQELLDRSFEGVETTGDTKSFEDIKKQILDDIYESEKKGGSLYNEQIGEIQKATSVREIVYALKKGEF